MNFCSNCGKKVNENERFCSGCGICLSGDNSHQDNSYVHGDNWQAPPVFDADMNIKKNRKHRSVGRTIGYIFLALGIIITVIGGLIFGLGILLDSSIEQSESLNLILDNDKELAKYCAKSTVCQEYNVDEDDVNWKEVKCIKANKKKYNLVYVDCKLHDSDGKYRHIRWFVVINKIKYYEEDHDVEWKFVCIDWDEDEYDFDELKEMILEEYDFDD